MTTHVRFLLPHDLLWRTNQQPGTLFTDFQHIASRVTKKNYVCNFKTFVTAILFWKKNTRLLMWSHPVCRLVTNYM